MSLFWSCVTQTLKQPCNFLFLLPFRASSKASFCFCKNIPLFFKKITIYTRRVWQCPKFKKKENLLDTFYRVQDVSGRVCSVSVLDTSRMDTGGSGKCTCFLDDRQGHDDLQSVFLESSHSMSQKRDPLQHHILGFQDLASVITFTSLPLVKPLSKRHRFLTRQH